MGGAERQVCYLAQTLHRRGWEVAAISMLPLGRPIADLEAEGILTASLGMRQGVPDPRALVRLGRFLRAWRPDVLHGHMVHANLLARLSRLVARTPMVVSTIHNQDEGSQWRYVAYRLTDRLGDVTTTVSRVAVAESIRRGAVSANSIRLVPNGIRTIEYDRDEALRAVTRSALDLGDRFTWLAVGRLVPAKGYGDMLAAFAQARALHPDAELLIAGAGPQEESIRADAQAADAFVMSSRWEGLPMVLLEAGASSLPIVTTDVGGSRDAVVDGVSGFVTPVADPGAVGRAMSRVMELGAEDRQSMGAAGRAHVCREFDIEAVVDTWEALYRGAGSPAAGGS